MNNKSVILLSGLLAVGMSGFSGASAIAQDISVPAPETSQIPAPMRLNSDSLGVGTELQLNAQQRAAIEQLSQLALDQVESLVDSGFDPKKIDRAQLTRNAGNIQNLLTSLMPNASQKAGLKQLFKGALQQMRQQIQTDLNR